ncbi:Fibroblast growth factor receptor 2, partial [Armadillidium nasatum]
LKIKYFQIYFEPLPDITSHLSERNHSSRLSNSDTSNSNEDWFAEPFKNFPRNQLQYVRKLGSGWFGQVLEGRAIGIDTDHTSTVITKGISAKSTPVVVKALREDASAREQAFFLQELIPL